MVHTSAMRPSAHLQAFLALAVLGCGSAPPAPPAQRQDPHPPPTASASAAVPEPTIVDGWVEVRHAAYSLRIQPRSHALQRLEPLTRLVDDELARIRKAMGVSAAEGTGIVVYFHDVEEKGGPSRTRAFASWRSDGEVAAHFLAMADFDDRTPLLQSLVANELVKATTFALLRRSPTDHMDKPNSALAWLMEGSGTLLHTGGWFGKDVDALMTAFVEGGIDYPIPTILRADYRMAWKFNPGTTHTFNVIEFPEMASFTRYLWREFGPAKYTTLIRAVRERTDNDALGAFNDVYGAPVEELESRWRAALRNTPPADRSIDAPRLAKVVRTYVAVLEVSARCVTLDNQHARTWSTKYAADISVMPLLKLDLDAAEAALTRAHDGLLADLKAAATLLERSMAIRIALPTSRSGGKEALQPGGARVTTVRPGGLGARRSLQVGDEVRLLDSDIYAAVREAPKQPYAGSLRVTRAGEQQPIVLSP